MRGALALAMLAGNHACLPANEFLSTASTEKPITPQGYCECGQRISANKASCKSCFDAKQNEVSKIAC